LVSRLKENSLALRTFVDETGMLALSCNEACHHEARKFTVAGNRLLLARRTRREFAKF
jgi:hypothetical protein